MIGVTIGVGEWRGVAERAARRMSEMTGLECLVITEDAPGVYQAKSKVRDSAGAEVSEIGYGCFMRDVVHPSWLKCHLFEITQADSYLVFDADVVCLQEWEPEKIFEMMGRRFCAVAEDRTVPVMVECVNHRLPVVDWYVNGGLLMFGREHRPVWEEVWKHHPRYGSWLEQTALNEVLYGSGTEVCRLPRMFNTLMHGQERTAQVRKMEDGRWEMGNKEVVNVHADSLNGDWKRLEEFQKRLGI